jgi:hypothetical protein
MLQNKMPIRWDDQEKKYPMVEKKFSYLRAFPKRILSPCWSSQERLAIKAMFRRARVVIYPFKLYVYPSTDASAEKKRLNQSERLVSMYGRFTLPQWACRRFWGWLPFMQP